MNHFLKVGHRGARSYEPENTLRSFAAAVRLGVDIVEFDVRLTKDGRAVVIHDTTLDRTTTGRGRVRGWLLKDLKRLDAGKGERIPTLEEALDFMRWKKVRALVELKEKVGVYQIVKTVERFGGKDILISFYPDVLKRVAVLNHRLATGLVFSKRVGDIDRFLRFAKSCNSVWLLGQLRVLSKKLVQAANQWGFEVEAWVANDRVTVRKIAALGVQAIASDKPDVLKI